MAIAAAAPTVTGSELPAVNYEPFASGFTAPLAMVPYRDGDHAFLVVDQTGVISFLGEKGGKPTGTFLDLRSKMVTLRPNFDERGLLGIALHPGFTRNGKVYVYYSAPLRKDGPKGFDHTGRLVEFKVPKGGHTADPATERLILSVDQPQWNHNGGLPVFGPDGYLYLGLGDGGAGNDRAMGHEDGGNGQALNRLLGKILRIDVNSGDPYGIPADNPLVGKEGRDEIYAWGIRNPWGLTFDTGGAGELIVADVGQNRFEEINVVRNGGNYGWPRAEGLASFDQKNPGEVTTVTATTAPATCLPPVLVYPHNESYGAAKAYGISVTGGHVYRGKAIEGLQGVYVFADWGTSWAVRNAGLFAGVRSKDGSWTMEILPGAKTPGKDSAMVTGFARDHDGELYVITNGSKSPTNANGAVWKIVPAP
jgi:glucose/arabinose dehydrogenase